jgi:peroxiredoxin
MEQLTAFGAEKDAFSGVDASVVAVTPEKWDGNPQLFKDDPTMPSILSDPGGPVAALYGARDEFENLPLHATILIDREGRIRWRNVGSEPFMDAKFLIKEIERLEAKARIGG